MKKNRWLILAAAIIMNICIGTAYTWSVFQIPLINLFNWTTPQASLAYTINLSIVPLAMIVAGRVQDKKGPRIVTLVGGVIFGLGMYLAGTVSSIQGLYLTYGLLGGVGIGTVYACTVGNTIKWFPDKRGLAGGLTAMGFGLGAVIFAPIAARMILDLGVLRTFNIFGILFAIGIVMASFLMAAPDVGWKPEGFVPNPAAINRVGPDHTPREMLKSVDFYLIWVMYTIGCVGGLMIIGHASPIGQEKIGLSPATAAVAISFLGVANSVGRVFWGSISDRIGRYNTLACMYLVSGVCLMVLNIASTFAFFLIGICGIAMSFGGYLGIMPSVTADNFGAKNIGINYGVLFTAFGLAAFVGPRIAAVVKEASGGNYGMAFMIVTAMNVVGVLLTLYVKKRVQVKRNLENVA